MSTLSLALDDLAEIAAQAADDTATRAVLARTVCSLEQAAGAGLGRVDGDPLVVLQRRLGRAARRLAADPAPGAATTLTSAQVRAHAAALRCPETTAVRRPDVRVRPAGALVGC